MKLHFIRYFIVLAEELHFGRAARRLAITQPPLSAAIKLLEEELQVQLLERSSKRVELTAPGAAFLAEARQALERVDRAGRVAKAVANGARGRLDIGMTGSMIYRGVPAIVKRFEKSYPGVDLVLAEMSTGEQMQALLNGQLHAGFINGSAIPPQLKSIKLADDEFVLCLPKSHRMVGARSVDLQELAGEKFVMFARDVAPANHDNVIAIFNRAGVHPRTIHAARQWLTVIAMVSHGLGVAIVPRSLTRSLAGGVSFVRIRGSQLTASAMLAWNPERPSAALSAFLNSAISTTAASRIGKGHA
jgi:DNA-binding transcriptional LysR family regulator